MPADETVAGCTTTPSLLASAPKVESGKITVTALGSLLSQLTANSGGSTVIFDPVYSTGSITAWNCNGGTVIPKYLPAVCRSTNS